MRIRKLPAVLQININRFGINHIGDMIKINSRCEFGDYLNFDLIMEGTDSYELSQKSDRISSQTAAQNIKALKDSKHNNTYRLHAILCHNGTLNSGHYFCYLRVGSGESGDGFDDKRWIKFNDQSVSRVFKHQALAMG